MTFASRTQFHDHTVQHAGKPILKVYNYWQLSPLCVFADPAAACWWRLAPHRQRGVPALRAAVRPPAVRPGLRPAPRARLPPARPHLRRALRALGRASQPRARPGRAVLAASVRPRLHLRVSTCRRETSPRYSYSVVNSVQCSVICYVVLSSTKVSSRSEAMQRTVSMFKQITLFSRHISS